MSPVIGLLPLLVLIAFYLYMFRDMTYNDALSPAEKYNWTLAFILLNVFAAAYYYVNVYRYR